MDKFLPFLYEKKPVRDQDNYLYLEVPDLHFEEIQNEKLEENKIIIIEII